MMSVHRGDLMVTSTMDSVALCCTRRSPRISLTLATYGVCVKLYVFEGSVCSALAPARCAQLAHGQTMSWFAVRSFTGWQGHLSCVGLCAMRDACMYTRLHSPLLTGKCRGQWRCQTRECGAHGRWPGTRLSLAGCARSHTKPAHRASPSRPLAPLLGWSQ